MPVVNITRGYEFFCHPQPSFLSCTGLSICWDRGFRFVTCVSDSLIVVTYINRGVSLHHRYNTVIGEIRKFLHLDWQMSITHECREENQCANYLANLAANSGSAETMLDTPPPRLLVQLSTNAASVSFTRR